MIGYSLAKQYGMKLIFVNSPGDKRPQMRTYSIFKDCQIIDPPIPVDNIHIGEKHWSYYGSIKIPDNKKNYALDGYFQSYHHSCAYINDIKHLFDNEPKKAKMEDYFHLNNPLKKPVIMVHVRRGDYLAIPDFHPVQTDAYYDTALKSITSKLGDCKLFLFSDDVPFLKNWPLIKGYDHLVVENEDTIESFILMTLCDHFIIANSSYSLLAYYFRENQNQNQNAFVAIPQRWFGPRGPRYNLDHLIPASPFRGVF
jgi:hypothetical protein